MTNKQDITNWVFHLSLIIKDEMVKIENLELGKIYHQKAHSALWSAPDEGIRKGK